MVYTDDMYIEHSKMILNFLRMKYSFVFKQDYFEDLFSYCKLFIYEKYNKNYDDKKSKSSTYIYILCSTAVAEFFRKNNKHLKYCKRSLNEIVFSENKHMELQDVIKEEYSYFDQFENSDYIRHLYKKCINYINNDLKTPKNRLASDKFKSNTKIIFKCKIITDSSFVDIASKLNCSCSYCQRLYSNLITQLREYFEKNKYFL